MRSDDSKNRRKSTRLKDYDYRAGIYFITVCAQNKHLLFGAVAEGVMQLNECGRIVWEVWNDLPHHYPYVILDAFIVMPNHVHGIIALTDERTDIPDARAAMNLSPTTLSETNPSDLRHFSAPPQSVPKISPETHPPVGAGLKPAPTVGARRHGLPEIIRAFKTFSARRINDLQGALGRPIWQRSFYDHVIRKEESMDRIREYIFNNPAQWEYDRENPAGQA